MRILFSGGGGAGNEALWRFLNGKYDMYFGDADVDSINPSIPVTRRILLPWASDPDFVSVVIGLCRKHSIDFLVPGVDEELPLLASRENDFSPTKLFLPDERYVNTMLDKFRMVESLKNKGIEVPFTKKASEGFEGISFPCILKPRHGRGSREVQIVNNAREAVSFLEFLGSRAEKYVFQEKMDGIEYTVQVIADERKVLRALVPVRVILKRGITISAVVDPHDAVLEMCKKLHSAVPTKFCYNVQLMLSREGNARPFEINPRISTTFCLAIASGINPFDVSPSCWDEGKILVGRSVRLHRYWNNIIEE